MGAAMRQGLAADAAGEQTRASAPLHSLVLIDCGTVFTKLALVGLVENTYRVLARVQTPTTAAPPVADVLAGIREGLRLLEQITGRVLTGDGEPLIRPADGDSGIDVITASFTAGGPLRLVLLGPGRESVAGLLHRALGGLYVRIETPRDDGHLSASDANEPLSVEQPHAALVVGSPMGAIKGSDTLDQSVQQVARLLAPHGASLSDGSAPAAAGATAIPVLFSGSPEDGAMLARVVEEAGGAVQRMEPLTSATLGPMTRAMSALYPSHVLRRVPGFQALERHLSTTPLASPTSLGGAVRYLAHSSGMTVVGVDVGASHTSLAGALGSGEYLPADAPGIGVSLGAGQTVRAAGAEQVVRWLPFAASEHEVTEYALSRMLRPRVLASTPRELELEYALAREAIRQALHAPGSRLGGMQSFDVLIGTGGVFAHVAHPGYATLLLLDALEPHGITSFVLDPATLVPMLGTVASVAPDVAAALADVDAVPLVLGPVVSVAGQLADGQVALRAVLEYPDGREHIEDVTAGSLRRLPLGPGEKAHLALYPAAQVDVGLGPGQHARASEPVEGGVLGVVVDARGRTLALPQSRDAAIAKQLEWRRALGIEV